MGDIWHRFSEIRWYLSNGRPGRDGLRRLCRKSSFPLCVKLLQELCKADVVDLAAGCCGLAGTSGMQKKNYELSSKISEGLWAALESCAAENVLTECAACRMQIRHISDCVVRHPITVLAEAYGR